MARSVVILGSTGSIGRSALDVVRRHPDRFRVTGLAGRGNASRLIDQVREFEPARVAVAEPSAAEAVRAACPGTEVMTGPEGLEALAGCGADVVLCAVVGAAGLRPILRAIEAGSRVALANKEPLVMAGGLILAEAERRGVAITPVDSEHSAIFQCLHGHAPEDVHGIALTASGGPFYRRKREELAGVSPEQAAKHPTWDMGTKISVDSATLMNKGLEVIEAMWLFGLPVSRIRVLIHPQSIVHGLVEFTDGSILAHLGLTDMKFPIEYALTWPERVASPMGRLDLAEIGSLTFAEPDFSEFPCLGYALEAARAGELATTLLNAANEAAVEAFCAHRIGFLAIPEVVRHVMDTCPATGAMTLEAVLEADATARRAAEERIAAAANP